MKTDEVRLTRTLEVLENCTLGMISYAATSWATLEPPWRENRPNVSSIPAGHYSMVPWLSTRHGATWRVYGGNVGDWENARRRGIEFHVGNFSTQTRGCIMLGESTRFFAATDGERNQGVTSPMLVESRRAFGGFLEIVPRDRVVTLRISNVGEVGDGQLPRVHK